MISVVRDPTRAAFYYEVLGLPYGADASEIRSAYRDLVFLLHPDRVLGNERIKERASQHLRKIIEAFDYLSDWLRRSSAASASTESPRQHVSVALLPRNPEPLYRDTAFDTPHRREPFIKPSAWRNLISRLRAHPDELFSLQPRQFELLVADVLRDQGYTVEVTRISKDGGRDLLVAIPRDLGDFLYLVECKRYAKNQHVGVRRVRELYGVVEQERATAGILITTSSFTQDARAFQRPIRQRLSLRDYDDVASWLRGRSSIMSCDGGLTLV